MECYINRQKLTNSGKIMQEMAVSDRIESLLREKSCV